MSDHTFSTPTGVAKAVAAGLAAAMGSLLLVLTGDQSLTDVTTVQWLQVGVNVLGSFGVVWAIPNRPL